ncbi:hypothetical protein LCGC14_2093870, partial [marine sediment metagenome]
MKEAIFDLETDGLYFDATKVHSLCIGEAGTDFLLSCTDHEYKPLYPTTIATDINEKWGVVEGLKVLEEADLIIGHNIINFDLPTIQKIYPDFKYDITKVRDTLLLSRLLYPNLSDRDTGLIKAGKLPPRLRGSHSLKAWGYRLGIYKGEFGQSTDWQNWTPEMQAYCEQDVEVTKALWEKLKARQVADRASELEHWFAYIISLQE